MKQISRDQSLLSKRAFTLIELLAVIVILAIIALIATPIILNTIDSTKKSATDRSKEMYLDAVEQAIARKNLTTSFNPSTCTVKSDGNLNCDVGELTIEFKGQRPNEGGIIEIKDGEIISNNLDFGDGTKNIEEPIYQAATDANKTAAGKVPQGNFEPGDEYIINVDGTNKYHFYVLGTSEEKVTLIMSDKICKSVWYSKLNNSYGPVSAFDYLHQLTKNWSNIDNIYIDYEDEGNHYGKIKTTGIITNITTKDDTVTGTYENLKARLPKLSEIEATGCGDEEGSCPSWMISNNDGSAPGYWALSSSLYNNNSAIIGMLDSGNVSGWYVTTDDQADGDPLFFITNNIRPVIEVSKSNLS